MMDMPNGFENQPIEAVSLTIRLSKVFKREGVPLKEFQAELASLTAADKNDFRKWFAEAGFPCT